MSDTSLTKLRDAYIKRFSLPKRKRHDHLLTPTFLEQLQKCKDDAARRLLLGRSR